jgi:hypothetical protein
MSTEIAPVPTTILAATSGDDPMTSTAGYQHAYVLAKRFSESQLVPAHLRGKPQDCFVALLMAREMNESPIMVMQSIYFVSGKAGWSASYMIARANASGRFARPINWRVTGKGDAMAVEAYAVTAHGDEVSISVSMAMAKAEGWTSNKKYQTMPELMLRYRSATMLIRLYCPEVLLGMHTADEHEDVAASRSVTVTKRPTETTAYLDPEPVAEAEVEPAPAREPGEEG